MNSYSSHIIPTSNANITAMADIPKAPAFSNSFVFYSRYIKIKELEKAGALGISAIAVMFAFGVGMIWELYEFMLSANFSREGYAMDTLIDLIMDVSGALVGYVIFTLQRERYIHGR